jgi:separase
LKLALARKYIFKTDHGVQEIDALSACEEVIRLSPDCESQASALYYAGLIELGRARRSGELARLWDGYSNLNTTEVGGVTNDQECVTKARSHLTSLLRFLGPASDRLTREALRSLCLTLGPHSQEAAELIHTSIGGSVRLSIARRIENSNALIAQSESTDKMNVASLLRALDFPFADADREKEVKRIFQRLESLLPTDWRVIACALCPTGELLISSLSANDLGNLKPFTVCMFPESGEGGDYVVSAYESILTPLDRIIDASQGQLQSNTAQDVLPREWWSMRTDLDHRLQELICRVEQGWFGSEAAQLAILGVGGMNNSHFHVNLASKFEAAVAHDEEQLSVATSPSGSCLLLILDENLQRFPFEGMSCFQGLAICRQPSIPFLVAKLVELSGGNQFEYQAALADLDRVSYILDPESNLPGTVKRLQPFLDELEQKLEVKWESVVGEAPSKDFFERSVSQHEGVLLYFGHGNGQSHFSKSDVERLVGSLESDSSERRVRSSIILMGCSSGRLESVNRRGSRLADRELPIYHEPEGLALCYLSCGASCVVGNLWDVTDRDIDAFAVNMLDRFSCDNAGVSLAECVAHARSACKLRYMTGCAPVCYGVPVFKKYA